MADFSSYKPVIGDTNNYPPQLSGFIDAVQAFCTEIENARQAQSNLLTNLQRFIIAANGLTVDLDAAGHRIKNLPSPGAGSDPATKTYADGLAFASALPAQSGKNGRVVSTDGTTAAWGFQLKPLVVTGTSASAAVGNLLVLTNAAACTVQAPATPADGDMFAVATNSLLTNVVAGNGSTIMGLAEDIILNVVQTVFTFRYLNGTWRLI